MSEEKKAPVAGCVCGSPLVMTFAFTKFEFICLDCGRQYEWLMPEKMEPTKKNLALMEKLEAEWEPIGKALLTRGVIHKECPKCSTNEDHLSHATDEEKAAHEAALEWLKQRIKK